MRKNSLLPNPAQESNAEDRRGIICSLLIKWNTDDLRSIFMCAFPLTKVKGLEKGSWCGWVCLCWHYLDRGQSRALGSIPPPYRQHLVGKWRAAGAARWGNLWAGQDGALHWTAAKRRRKQKTDGKGRRFLGILLWKGYHAVRLRQFSPQIFIKQQLQVRHGTYRVNKRVSFLILITPGRCFRKNVARGRFYFSPWYFHFWEPNFLLYFLSFALYPIRTCSDNKNKLKCIQSVL